MNKTCALIFSAGKGIRLRPLTENLLKMHRNGISWIVEK